MNEMNVFFPSCPANESFAQVVTSAFVAQMDPTIDGIPGVKTAMSKAVINCIVHTYHDTLGMIYIAARLYEDGGVRVRIRDKGRSIEDMQKAREPLFTTGGEERAGLGFAAMGSFVNDVLVTSHVQKGTTVTLKRKLARRRAPNG